MKVVAMPIDVVAWFDKEGIPNPVRFRVSTKDYKEQVVKIKYEIDTWKWMLFKI